MKGRSLGSHALVVVGVIAMLVGAIDPLEGSFVILPGSGLVALGALVGKSRYRLLFCVALLLIAAGVGAMVVLSQCGGIGGHSGHSMWWGLLILPYPVGWILSLTGVVLRVMECRKAAAFHTVGNS